MRLPVTAYASIIHRVSGVILFFVAGIFLWLLDGSLSSSEGFDAIKECLTSPLAKLVIWGCLSALAYHFVAGIRHLIMDMGVGESLEGGKRGARLVFVFSVILIALAGVWVW